MENPESVAISSVPLQFACLLDCLSSRHFLPVEVYFAPLLAHIHAEALRLTRRATEAHSFSFTV
jgi:hypothetical protein